MMDNHKYLMKNKDVKKWLGGKYNAAPLSALSKYLEFTKKEPSELIDEWEAYNKEHGNDRDATNLTKQRIFEFREWLLNDPEISKNSAITYCSRILGFYHTTTGKKLFFTYHEKKKFKRDKGKKKKTPLSVETIKKIVEALRYHRDKAAIMCLKSSGMPVGDLLELRIKDLEGIEGKDMYLIDTTRIKNETRYVTIFDEEATGYLNRYLDLEREFEEVVGEDGKKKLVKIPLKPDDYVFVDLINFEQLRTNTLLLAITRIVKKIGMENITPYTFRRFFTTTMKSAGLDNLYIDFMTGHETDAVKTAYDDLVNSPRELLLPEYLKYSRKLSIFNGNNHNTKGKVAVLEERVAELEKELKIMRKIVDDIVDKQIFLKKPIDQKWNFRPLF